MASQFTDALYYLWTFYTGFQAILILYAGLRLLRLLNRHLLQRTDSRVDLGRVRLGALKVYTSYPHFLFLTVDVCGALTTCHLNLTKNG